jgi:BirA family biotin operon repressor/biotin-[acetyl-CoA-carboxylase] ligase
MEEIRIFNPFGGKVLWYPKVESTMRVIREQPEDGKIVAAGEQSRGRGRTAGRSWQSAPGESLLFSLALRRKRLEVPQTSLPIRAALAVSRLLSEKFGLSAEIKWPNDVLVGGKKISGILGESRGDYIFLGLGVNCRQKYFSAKLRRPATSVFLETGAELEIMPILELLLPRMEELFFHTGTDEFPDILKPWLYKIGEDFEVQEGTADRPRKAVGILLGVGGEGELRLLQKNGKIRSIYSGE